MATRLQLRRDTAANWTLANPTLASGELGIETDTKRIKIGNGSSAWAVLSYQSAAAGELTGTALPAAIVTSSLTVVGTIVTGVWQGTQIADTYLATIATAGKVSNSATTATANNTASAIVARDASGDFTARNITATLFNGPAASANEVSVANVTGLLSGGKILTSLLPALAITDTFVVASQVAMLALSAETGDVAVRSDLNKSFILRGTSASVLADWQELLTPTDAVLSVAGRTGAVTLVSGDITDATSTNTASRVVVRDGSGNFAAGTITATSFVGTLATAAQPNITTLASALTTGTINGQTISSAASFTGSMAVAGLLTVGPSPGSVASGFDRGIVQGTDATANDLSIAGPATSQVRLNFSKPGAAGQGSLKYNMASDTFSIDIAGATKGTWAAAGLSITGTLSATALITASAGITTALSSATVLTVNRGGTDGTIATFQQGGVTALSVAYNGTTITGHSSSADTDLLVFQRADGSVRAVLQYYQTDAARPMRIGTTTAHPVVLISNGTEVIRIGATSGSVSFLNIGTTGSAANAFLDSGANNNLLRSTSSRRYKADIRALTIDEARRIILGAAPVKYISKAVADRRRQFVGLVAEDMHEVDPRLVHFDAKGRPDGVMYDRLGVPVVTVLQDHEQRIVALEKRRVPEPR